MLEARKKAELKAQKKQLEIVPSTFTGFYVSLDKSSLAGYVGVTAKVLNLPDAYKIPSGREYKFNRSFDEKNNYRTKSMLIVPMKDASGNVVGVIQLINAHKGKNIVPFDKHFENLVLSLASQAAIAIKNTMLTQELKEAYLDTIFRLSVAARNTRTTILRSAHPPDEPILGHPGGRPGPLRGRGGKHPLRFAHARHRQAGRARFPSS